MEKDKLKSSSRWVHNASCFFRSLWVGPSQKILLLGACSLLIALLLTPSIDVAVPHYRLGDVAAHNIKANRNFLIEDQEATFRKHEEAARQAPLVYDLDPNVAQGIEAGLKVGFSVMRNFIAKMQSAPLQPLPLPSKAMATSAAEQSAANLPAQETRKQILQELPKFNKLLGVQVSDDTFLTLYGERFSNALENKILLLLDAAFNRGIVADKGLMLDAENKNLLIRNLKTHQGYTLPPPHLKPDLEEARRNVRMQALEIGGDTGQIFAAAALASDLLQANLTFNRIATEKMLRQAEAEVKPVYVQLKKNEMLVREGQRIGPEELLKLRAYERAQPTRHRIFFCLAMFLLAGMCIFVVVQVSRHHLPSYRMEFVDLVFLGALLVLLLVLARFTLGVTDIISNSPPLYDKTLIYAVPLTAGAMLASIFFGVTVSLIYSLLLTVFAGMLFGQNFALFFYFLMGCFVASHTVVPCRNRMIPLRAGLLVGCANVVLIVLFALLLEQWVVLRILTNAFAGFCGGVLAGILATGLTPLAEMAFCYTTDFKLLELATMDQPLLQELMVQAPGTYHHSIIVGNMVEGVAKCIGANPMLAKVAAYYHDIGKIKKPLYYIENQFDCSNRHEKLAPSMSSLILISHVKDGVELARQHRLGKALSDIISQHHGTNFISFFYKKALERAKAQSNKRSEPPPIAMDDYRYPGPKPQTKEAGLVMLADVVEAACRSLTNPTPARIKGMVNHLINNIFSDGQLDECELTLKDLHQIAKHFNQILATVHHKRIQYPLLAANDSKGRTDASDPGQRESRPGRNRPAEDRKSRRGNLRRLGLH